MAKRPFIASKRAAAITEEQLAAENKKIGEEKERARANLDQLKARQAHTKDQDARLGKIFEVLSNFHTIYDRLDSKDKKNIFGWVFRFLHAKRLRKHKPIFACKKRKTQ